MSKVLSILKLLNKISAVILPQQIYRPLRRYAQNKFYQWQILPPYRALKAIGYILPYRLYLSLEAKLLKKASLPNIGNGHQNLSNRDSGNNPLSMSNHLGFINLFPHKKKCQLVICCAFTGRHQVLAAAIQESFSSKYSPEIEWVLCGTTTEDLLFIETMQKTTNKVSGLIYENHPLGRKWQSCISFAGKFYDSRFYAIVGSDDIISADLINYIIEQDNLYESKSPMEERPILYATANWIVMVNDQSNFALGQIFQCKILPSEYFQPIGAGRFYKGSFLKEIDFQIFDTNRERLLDDLGYYTVKELNKSIHLYSIKDGLLISIKGSWRQLNTIKDFFDAKKTLELTEFSFDGVDFIHKKCSLATYDFLFKQGDIMQQLGFSGRS
jgi:hypothetical protein